MRVLVTGGAGFIGSNYVRYLLSEFDAIEVVTLDALTYAGERANLGPALRDERHRFVEGDVRDADTVRPLVADADSVVHFAAESAVDRSIDDDELFVSTNVEGTRTLLDAATETDLDSFVQVSTDEVYGQCTAGAWSEDAALTARNPYAATKASADLLAESYHVTHGVPVVVTRSSTNYGPRQHSEKFVPKVIERCVAGEPIPVYGDGSNVREWTYVLDNCRAIELVRRDGSPGTAYNVGSGDRFTNVSVAERIVDATGASPDLVEFVDDRPGHSQRYALDSSRVRDLGWSPEWSFADGLDATIDYVTS